MILPRQLLRVDPDGEIRLRLREPVPDSVCKIVSVLNPDVDAGELDGDHQICFFLSSHCP